jgi:hypothetical protein
MKVLIAVLVAWLSIRCNAGECGAGYEEQFMDENSIGYCTRIPSLQEQADRAEAFVKHGVPKMQHLCVMMNRDSTPTWVRQEYVNRWEIMGATVSIMRMAPYSGIKAPDVDTFNKIARSPEGKRITAALDIVQKQIQSCKDEK